MLSEQERRRKPPKNRCVYTKRNGERCRLAPIKGATVCHKHGGSARHIREAAQRRLLEAADGLMANLLRIAMSGESEANRLRATMDALSRAGLVERHIVHVGTTDPFADVLAGILDDDVFRDATDRALPSGAGPVHHDEDYDDPHPYDPAEDELGPDDLSFHTEDTIPGEVVHEVTRVVSRPTPPARVRRGLGPPAGRADFAR